ncbi:MAG: bifunctional diguanylate cyclase/phosphodiesterase, partial [Desulfovibrio sp.]|nr:bifunctional diguanylate cyclase/phosphodiesterase [Desulfovibrio sp.]
VNYTGIAFCFLQIVAVIVNIFSPILFYIDDNVEYHTSLLRYVSFIFQAIMFLFSSIYTLSIASIADGKKKLRYRTIGFFGIAMIVAIIIQIIYPLLPMYTVGYLIGCCVLHTFVLEDAKEEYRVKHDLLTDLPNTFYLAEQLPEIIKMAKREKVTVGLLYIGFDNFKSVNNCYGHKHGDAVLCTITERLRDLSEPRYLARSNGDTFQVVLTGQNKESIISQANYIFATMGEPFTVQGNMLYIGASMGLAFIDGDDDSTMNLLHYAELAMFDAKSHGGNSLSLYEESMRASAYDKTQLENALHNAVEHNEFTVFYQPKIDISKKDVAGCEALVRWRKNDGKWVSPATFIPLAEETGLVTCIDMFVLRTACRQVLVWKNAGLGVVPVAVNMSVHSILSAGFADKVIHILEEEGTPSSLIDIEITETSFMSDMSRAFEVISRLHEAGIRIALDDFGTGYSSLQYLSAMPISFLKIDRKFVDDIFSGKVTAQPLVRSIISLAENLRMHVISEGVEKKEQLRFLADNGADIIQGYIFSKPLSSDDCEMYLRDREARIATVLESA